MSVRCAVLHEMYTRDTDMLYDLIWIKSETDFVKCPSNDSQSFRSDAFLRRRDSTVIFRSVVNKPSKHCGVTGLEVIASVFQS